MEENGRTSAHNTMEQSFVHERYTRDANNDNAGLTLLIESSGFTANSRIFIN